MTKYLIVMLMICGGCVLLDGTPTATPGPTALPTPDITPTQEIIADVPLNINHDFAESCPPGPILSFKGRDVCKPEGWRVLWIPNPAIHDDNPHPEVLARNDGMRFEISHRGGAFGFGSDVFCPGRCIIVGEYVADIKPITGAALNRDDYFGYCRFDDGYLSKTVWRGKAQGEGEFICAFEVKSPRLVRFDALLNITWQVVEGHIDFTEVRALQVAPDSFDDSVVYVP